MTKKIDKAPILTHEGKPVEVGMALYSITNTEGVVNTSKGYRSNYTEPDKIEFTAPNVRELKVIGIDYRRRKVLAQDQSNGQEFDITPWALNDGTTPRYFTDKKAADREAKRLGELFIAKALRDTQTRISQADKDLTKAKEEHKERIEALSRIKNRVIALAKKNGVALS